MTAIKKSSLVRQEEVTVDRIIYSSRFTFKLLCLRTLHLVFILNYVESLFFASLVVFILGLKRISESVYVGENYIISKQPLILYFIAFPISKFSTSYLWPYSSRQFLRSLIFCVNKDFFFFSSPSIFHCIDHTESFSSSSFFFLFLLFGQIINFQALST